MTKKLYWWQFLAAAAVTQLRVGELMCRIEAAHRRCEGLCPYPGQSLQEWRSETRVS